MRKDVSPKRRIARDAGREHRIHDVDFAAGTAPGAHPERHPLGADRETVGRALHVAADEHAAVRRLERRAYAEFAVRTIRLLLHRPRRPHQRGAHAQTSFRKELPAASRATPKYSATVAP